MNKEIVTTSLSHMRDKRILVVGDLMLDTFTYGTVSRISPEAPVPVLQITHEVSMPGGAGNVAVNLAKLGVKTSIIGIIGKDSASKTLTQELRKNNIATKYLIADSKRPTILKHRFIAKYNQILRVDEEKINNLSVEIEKKVLTYFQELLPKVDGIILSDYAKGFFSESLTKKLIAAAKKEKKLLVADVKPINKEYFKGVSLIKPNLKEAKEMSGLSELSEIGLFLTSYFKSHILITKSDEGMTLFLKSGKSVQIPSKKVEIADVSGAGDTIIAVMTACLVAGLPLEEAAFMANYAGEIVVQKLGTAWVSYDELSTIFHNIRHADETEIVPKLWGYEKWLENNDKYCCKILSIKKGYQCSLHYHKEKDEMFFLVKGNIRLESNGEVSFMREGNFARITPGTKHRFRGIVDSMIIEVSTHHEESDSYRIEESKKVE